MRFRHTPLQERINGQQRAELAAAKTLAKQLHRPVAIALLRNHRGEFVRQVVGLTEALDVVSVIETICNPNGTVS